MKYWPKLYQLRAFKEVVRYGSINTAAKMVGVSQPTLSRTIKELENLLGTPLLVRGSYGIDLTEAGRAFAARTNLVLEEVVRAVEETAQIAELSKGTVAFGISPIVAHSFMAEALKEYSKHLPNVKIHIEDAQLHTHMVGLRDGRLDFAIGNKASKVSLTDFIVEPLFNVKFAIVARQGHPLSGCTSFSQLTEAKWWFTGYCKNIEDQIPEFQNGEMNKAVYADSLITGLPLVVNNDHLSILSVVQAQKFSEQLCMLPIESEHLMGEFVLLYTRKRPLTATARKLINIFHWHAKYYSWTA